MWCGQCIYMGVTNRGLLNDGEPCEMRGTWLASRSSVTQPASALGKHAPPPPSRVNNIFPAAKNTTRRRNVVHIQIDVLHFHLIMSACSFSSFLVFITRLWHYSPFLTSLYTHAHTLLRSVTSCPDVTKSDQWVCFSLKEKTLRDLGEDGRITLILELSVDWQHVMSVKWKVKVYARKRMGSGDITPPQLASAIGGGKWSASRPSRFASRETARSTHYKGGWMGFSWTLWTTERPFGPAGNRNPIPLSSRP